MHFYTVNRLFLAAAFVEAVYTYTITMSTSTEAIYVVSNVIAFISWLLLAILVHAARQRYSDRTLVLSWLRPLTFAFKIMCAVSALRCVANISMLVMPIPVEASAAIFVGNNIMLAIAVGFAAAYYRRFPDLMEHMAIHQRDAHRFQAMMDASTEGLIEFDPEGIIWYANEAAANMLSRTQQSLLGQSIAITGLDVLNQIVGVTRRDTLPSGASVDVCLSTYEISGVKRYLAAIRYVVSY